MPVGTSRTRRGGASASGRRRRRWILDDDDESLSESDWLYKLDDWFLTVLLHLNRPLMWLGRGLVWLVLEWGLRFWIDDEPPAEIGGDDQASITAESTGSSTSLLPIQHLEIHLPLSPTQPVLQMSVTPRPEASIDLDSIVDPNEETKSVVAEREHTKQRGSKNVGGGMDVYRGLSKEETANAYKSNVAIPNDEFSSLTSSKQQQQLAQQEAVPEEPKEIGSLPFVEDPFRTTRKKHKNKRKRKERRNSIPREIVYQRSTIETDMDVDEDIHEDDDSDASLFDFIEAEKSRRNKKRQKREAKAHNGSRSSKKKKEKKRKRVSEDHKEEQGEVQVQPPSAAKEDPPEPEKKKKDPSITSKQPPPEEEPVPDPPPQDDKKYTKVPSDAQGLPPSYSDRFHEMGFCDWNRKMLACLIVNPFDFETKSSLHKSWISMARKHLRLHKRLDEGDLKFFVYWYADQTYSIVDAHKFIPWKEGKQSWKTLPKYLIAKVEQDKSVTEYEAQRVAGHEECQESLLKPPSLRTHPQMKLTTVVTKKASRAARRSSR